MKQLVTHMTCNKKIKENNNLIPIFAHKLFSFYFCFAVKGIRWCVWRIRQLNIGGTNVTNVQYANIGNQVKFIDTIKYYQLSRVWGPSVNKKHKGLRNGASGMKFEDCAKRISSIRETETFGQLPKQKDKQNKFTIKNDPLRWFLKKLKNLNWRKEALF